MNPTKIIPMEELTSALSGGDADVLREWTESLSRQKAMIVENSGRASLEYQIYREVEERLTRRCAELEAEVARNARHRVDGELAEKCRLLETALRASQEECGTLRKICEADKLIQSLNAAEENENRERAERIDEQSERLRRYAEALNREKEWIRATAAQMEEEIRGAAAMHPLNDYFLLTEKEVTRTEIELKRTPASSPTRAKLEEVFAQLVAQREFLRTVMEASATEAEARADRLAKIRADSRSAPVPPHPSSKRPSSGA
ncbi:MAG: hypothetical protein JST04_15075 [Bdellovibrionales bacterium]|nr:hypothetical protein [Bdellovibrionales bacterium]